MNKKGIWIVLMAIVILGQGIGLFYCIRNSRAFSQELKSARPEHEKLTAENLQIKNRYDEMMEDYNALKQDHEALAKQFETFTEQDRKVKTLTSSLEASQQEVQKMQAQHQELTQKNEQLTRHNEELSRQNADREQEIKKLKDTQVQLTLQNQETKAFSEALGQKLEEYKKKHDELLAKNITLESEIKKIPTSFTSVAQQDRMLVKDNALMHYNLGVFYTLNKEYHQAIEEFERVLEMDPEDAHSHFNLGYIYAKHVVDQEKAVKHFRRFLQMAKGDDADVEWVKEYLLTHRAYEAMDPFKQTP